MSFISEALDFDPNGPNKIDKGREEGRQGRESFKAKCRAVKDCADSDGGEGEGPDELEDELGEQAARAAVAAFNNERFQKAMDPGNAQRTELLDDLVEMGAIDEDERGEVDDLMEGSYTGLDMGGDIVRLRNPP